MLTILQHLDEKILLFINGRNSLFLDNLMFWASGKFSWLPFYILLILIIVYFLRRKTLLLIAFVILLITLSDQSSVHLFKEVFHRLRPCHNPSISEQIHLVNNHCGGLYGFISSHASNTFAVAVFLMHALRIRWLTVGLLAWAVLVSYSRVYLGVHYPFDVLAGALWGALLGYLIYKLYCVSGKNAGSGKVMDNAKKPLHSSG